MTAVEFGVTKEEETWWETDVGARSQEASTEGHPQEPAPGTQGTRAPWLPLSRPVTGQLDHLEASSRQSRNRGRGHTQQEPRMGVWGTWGLLTRFLPF